MLRIILVVSTVLLGQANCGIVPALESACPLPNANGVSTFVIPVNSSIGTFNGMLIKFDTNRHLPVSSTILQDSLNALKAVSRASAAEPFRPVSQTCPSMAVPKIQMNCTGGISMTEPQKLKATPRYTWDRGHLTPANPMRFSDDALDKTFICPNLAPQDSYTNQNPWKDVEVKTEDKLTTGYVMTGLCSADNLVDGPTTYRGYTIPQCFWKLACYKDAANVVRVVGFIGENTIVNFSDLPGRAARNAATFTPRSQSEILALLTNPNVVSEGWSEAVTNLLPGRQVVKTSLPTAAQCTAATTLAPEVFTEWHDYMLA